VLICVTIVSACVNCVNTIVTQIKICVDTIVTQIQSIWTQRQH